MNARQGIATGLIALLMLATILAMPPQAAGSRDPASGRIRHAGTITPAPAVSVELPQDQVRDYAYR